MKSEVFSSQDSLRDFVHQHAKRRGVPLRKVGEALGYKPPYFSDLLNGKKKRSVEFLNALAEYLNVPRVDVYQAAGLLQISEHEALRAKLDELIMNEPTVRQALDMMVALDREDMLKMATWMIVHSVQSIQKKSGQTAQQDEDEAEELQAFPENSQIPPAFMNLVAQFVFRYFRLGSKGLKVDPKYDPFGDHSEYDGEDIDLPKKDE